MSNMIIGLGNTGTNVIKLAAQSKLLSDAEFYAIDSVASSMDADTLNKIVYIPIISDDKSGSGRDRERGAAMFRFHQTNGAFKEMYEEATKVQTPIIVISSTAGGTGSGSIVPLCESLINMGLDVIPILICPNKQDPAAFHLNTSDLFIELDEAGIKTYATFENKRGDADYRPINTEVVNMIELVLGKRFDATTLDSIDESDLDKLLEMPGRIMAVLAESPSIPKLAQEITRKLFVGSQPMWDRESVTGATLMTAFSLKSMFADTDFKEVFAEINDRIDPDTVYDNYRNIVKDDNDGVASAAVIITGLPPVEIKEITGDYKETRGLGAGVKRSIRPSFIGKKKASTKMTTPTDGSDPMSKFNWGKE